MLNHFLSSEIQERQKLQLLFDNYFKTRGCSGLIFTPVDSYARYDCSFFSGNTSVVAEFKNRNISVFQRTSIIIELTKYETLFEEYKKFRIPLLITYFEAEQIFAVWDLSKDIQYHLDCNLSPDYYFFPLACRKNGTTDEQKEKLVKHLRNEDAYFIDSNFNRLTFFDAVKLFYKG